MLSLCLYAQVLNLQGAYACRHGPHLCEVAPSLYTMTNLRVLSLGCNFSGKLPAGALMGDCSWGCGAAGLQWGQAAGRSGHFTRRGTGKKPTSTTCMHLYILSPFTKATSYSSP